MKKWIFMLIAIVLAMATIANAGERKERDDIHYTGTITYDNQPTLSTGASAWNVGSGAEADIKTLYDGNELDFRTDIDDSANSFEIGVGGTFETTERITILGTGTATLITLGDGVEADNAIVQDGVVDFRMGIDDSADSFEIGIGAAMETTERITILGTGANTVITFGDGAEGDQQVVFDGSAQDYYIGVDNAGLTDDLVVGLGAAVGTTPAFSIDETLVTTWSGGTLSLFEAVTAANVLTAAECGKTMTLANTTEFQTTLPAISTVSAGCSFKFIMKLNPTGADYTVITGNSQEDALYGGVNELEVDTNDDGPSIVGGDIITFVRDVALIGDYVEVISDGSYWFLSGQTAGDGGVTLAQN